MAVETRGEAAPQATGLNTPAGGEFSPEMMQGVFGRFGKKLPEKPGAPAAAAGAETRAEASAEQGAPAAAEAAGEEHQRAGSETAAPAAGAEGAGAEAEQQEQREERPAGEEAEAQAGAEGEQPERDAAGDGAEPDPDTEKLVQRKLKDLPEDTRKLVQSVINERVGEISRKSRAENDRLANQLVQVNGELETLRKDGRITYSVPNVHPAALAETPKEIDQHQGEIEKYIDFLDAHRDSGIEPDPEKGHPGYTPEQVRAELRSAQRSLEKDIPHARAVLANRERADSALKVVLPEFFDPRSEHYAAAQRIRKDMPEFRRFANSNVLIAQFLLGAAELTRRVQQADASRAGKQPTGGKPAAKPAGKPVKRAPRAPGDGSPSRLSPLDDPRSRRPDPTDAIQRVTQTRSRSDLIDAVRQLTMR